ncbi:hypothetical protein Aduo_008955 [Ancylostoma duodenale]
MNVYASTSSGSSPEGFRVRVPRSRQENKSLKKGFVDDNNEHLSYFNFPVLWPATACAVFCTTLFGVGVAGSLYTDYVPTELELKRTFFARYGSSHFTCNTTLPFPENGIPSVLNLFEINVIGNVLFRLCVCIPMVVRIFISNCHSYVLRAEYEELPFFFRVSIELVPMLTTIEVITMAMFSIITVHSDFPEVNRLCKVVFVMTAGVNMVLTSAIQYSFSKSSQERIDHLSAAVKMVTACVFCYLAPQYFQHHHSAISFPICFSYMPRIYAFMEYVMIVSYGIFHTTSLIDIRHISFMCYPRTCSGECEPLDPVNFAKDAKYEHCRAFEYQQRRTHIL